MDDYQTIVAKALQQVKEVFPWDLQDEIKQNKNLILLDIRELYEFEMMHIQHALHVPRGVLEGACCWNYDETIPALANARTQNIVLVCRSGNRSVLAAQSMQQMGFTQVRSLKMGIKGWNDSDFQMLDKNANVVNIDKADAWLNATVAKEKLNPNGS